MIALPLLWRLGGVAALAALAGGGLLWWTGAIRHEERERLAAESLRTQTERLGRAQDAERDIRGRSDGDLVRWLHERLARAR